MKKYALLAVCTAGVAVASGCMMNAGGSLMSSSKPVQQGKYTVIGDRVTGTDSQWVLPGGFYVGKPGSPCLRALDEAQSQVPGADALIEVSENVEMIMFGPVQKITTRVTGTPVKIKE